MLNLTVTGHFLLAAFILTLAIIFCILFENNCYGQIEITPTKVVGFILDVLLVSCIILLTIKFGGIFTYYDTDGEVISVGYKGITVEYEGEYGKETQQIQIDTSEMYKEGDTVILQIQCCVFYYDKTVSIK